MQPDQCTCPTTELLSGGHLPDCPCSKLTASPEGGEERATVAWMTPDTSKSGSSLRELVEAMLHDKSVEIHIPKEATYSAPKFWTEPVPEYRVAIVRITREAMASLLMPPKGKGIVFRGVPDGALVLDMHDDFRLGCIEIKLMHPSFAVVHDGEEIPRIDVTAELVDITMMEKP